MLLFRCFYAHPEVVNYMMIRHENSYMGCIYFAENQSIVFRQNRYGKSISLQWPALFLQNEVCF